MTAPSTTASGPKQPSRRVAAIDGYRGIGALMVMLAHAALAGIVLFHGTAHTLVYGLDVALPLFFVLSGTMTYLPLVRGAMRGEAPGTGRLLSARLWRILPVYYVVILVVWSMRFNGSTVGWLDLLRHLTFTQVWSKDHIFWTDGPSWFLADDMYLFVLVALAGPPLARIAARRTTVGARMAVMGTLPLVLFLIGGGYMTIVNYALHVDSTSYYTFYNPIAKADQFAEGMALGMVLSIPGVMSPRPRAAAALTALGAAAIGSMWFLRSEALPLAVYYFTITGLACALLFAGAAMVSERQLIGRFLTSRALQFVSMLGFTVFLVQEPVMIQLEHWNAIYFQTPLALSLSTAAWIGCSLLVAWVTFRLVETPGNRLRRLLSDLRSSQARTAPRRSGPPPRSLPDVILRLPAGGPIALREMLGQRPLLVALDAEGQERLAEQRFRLDAGEADGLVVAADDGLDPDGAELLLDPDGTLATAINVPAVLLEVAPDGLITALHEPEAAIHEPEAVPA